MSDDPVGASIKVTGPFQLRPSDGSVESLGQMDGGGRLIPFPEFTVEVAAANVPGVSSSPLQRRVEPPVVAATLPTCPGRRASSAYIKEHSRRGEVLTSGRLPESPEHRKV
ncbi:UNVERIFIED_CONTAM: hypothetical protein HHA_451910 [Hammondia hammondi]|eukprot:XP_008884913.1 hypothetical protein HHA_451910 [Hammondia hammondi]